MEVNRVFKILWDCLESFSSCKWALWQACALKPSCLSMKSAQPSFTCDPLIFYNVKYIRLSPASASPVANAVFLQMWSDGGISPQKPLNLVLLCAMKATWCKGRLILHICIQRPHLHANPVGLRCRNHHSPSWTLAGSSQSCADETLSRIFAILSHQTIYIQ